MSINAQIGMGKDEADVLARACISKKVYSMYYKLPFKSSASAPEQAMFQDDQENLGPSDLQFNISQVSENTTTASTSASTVTSTNRRALRITGGTRRRRGARAAASTAVT